MTIKASGSLSLQEIDAEFGLGTNLGAYRGVKWWLDNNTQGTFNSSNISINEFYSKRSTSPVVPGSANYTTAGTFTFTVPVHNTLVVELWGPGSGGRSATSPGSSNPQVTSPTTWDGGQANGKPEATGGKGTYSDRSGGSGFNGDINLTGGTGTAGTGGTNRTGGAGANGGAGGTGTGDGTAPGGGGGGVGRVARGVTFYVNGGGGGGYCQKTYTSGTYSPGQTVEIVVAPGSLHTDLLDSGDGAVGRAIITWS